MNNIWKDLPTEIVDKITSIHYQTIHNNHLTNVKIQLLYYLNEFNYERDHNILSFWYRATPSNFKKYALFKSNLKKEINITSSNKRISRILRKQLNIKNIPIARQ